MKTEPSYLFQHDPLRIAKVEEFLEDFKEVRAGDPLQDLLHEEDLLHKEDQLLPLKKEETLHMFNAIVAKHMVTIKISVLEGMILKGMMIEK